MVKLIKISTFIVLMVITAGTSAEPPRLYSADGVYLGNVNSNRFDPNSISNPYGRYGNRFSSDSINNRFGKYGNRFSPDSVNNPYGYSQDSDEIDQDENR